MRKAYPLFLISVMLVFSAAVYAQLPEEIPVHWNLQGEADRYGGRLEGAFLLPLIALGFWGLMRVLPKIDPRKANYERFTETYELVINGTLTTMVLLHVAV